MPDPSGCGVAMYFAGDYRVLGQVDVGPLCALVAGFDEAAWDEQSHRQKTYKVHARTRTIPLIYDTDMRHEDPTIWPHFHRFTDALDPVMRRIREFYAPAHEAAGSPPNKGYFVRIILVRLASDSEIPAHVDRGASLSRVHRIHLPLITNDQALFEVAGNIRHVPAGELCEINNRALHAVRNGGPDRIHAILDYVVPGEVIDDPEGQLIA